MSRRGKGEGSVFYDRERAKWIGVLDLTEPGTGKRIRRKVSAPTRTKTKDGQDGAVEKLTALRRELEDTSPAAPRTVTVAAVVADWLDNLPRRIKDPTSVKLVRSHGARITRELGKVPVRKLEARQVERFLRGMADGGLSTSTIQQVHRVLARALDRAVRDRLVAVNVARVAEVPEGTRRRSRSMTEAQARQLLASDLDTWWRAYFTLALFLGLRPGELTGLRWEDVDLAAGVIRVRRSLKRGTDGLAPGDLKTQTSKRTLEMPEAVRAALTALRKEQAADKLRLGQHYWGEHDLVFRDSAGRPMSRQRMNVRFKQVMDQAGLGSDWQPRETRHTHASIASANGVAIEDIADALGHINANVTRAVYRQQISDTVTRAPAAMDRALARKAGEQA